MRTKRVMVVSIITFMLGGAGGAAYAYVTHTTIDGQMALPVNLEQAQENWAVEQFISEQEELRPNGLEQSKIETGSKYTGITYNNVGTATVKQKDTDNSDIQNVVNTESDDNDGKTEKEDDEKKEKGGFFSKLFGKKDKNEDTKDDQDITSNTNSNESNSSIIQGRIAVQKGSLNVRAKGDTNSKVIGQVYKNDTVQIVSQEGNWYQVITTDGLQGYVSATYVEKLSEE